MTNLHPDTKVFVIGQTMIDPSTIDAYLLHMGVSPNARLMIYDRELAIQSHMDRLVEVMGRLCYKSVEPGLNPNITKIREDAAIYLHNLIESGHGSVLEHASINFIISGVSRVFTHELVRHRVGTAFSQESMRYVRLTPDARIRLTPSLSDAHRDRLLNRVFDLMTEIDAVNKEIDLDNEKMGFTRKKKITSDLRSFVPMGVLTEMGFSANVRTLRHLIQVRTDPSAEQEIREIFSLIALACIERAPHMFADFECKQDGSWVPLYGKV